MRHVQDNKCDKNRNAIVFTVNGESGILIKKAQIWASFGVKMEELDNIN